MPVPSLQVVTRTGGAVDELNDAILTSVEWVRSDVGTLEFWMPATASKIASPLLMENEIQLWFGSWLAWWGYVWNARSNKAGTTFRCEELIGYFEGRDIRVDLTYSNLEQRSIGWNLVNYAQTGPDRNLHVTSAPIVGTTKLRTRVYLAEESWTVLGALRALSRVIDGLDFEIVPYGDGRRELTFYYPGQGAVRNDLIIEWGKNVADFDVIEQALPGEFANSVRILGPVSDPEGTERASGFYRDNASATKYGEWELTLSEGAQNSTQDWLDGRAQEEATQRSAPFTQAGFEMIEADSALLGVINKGDTIRASIHHGRVQLEESYRVHGIRYEHSNAPTKLKLAVTPA